ncbi:MAG: hypothetical protein MZU97_18275 [Bacillus subtilis]|nr:hypothetical protein [Bacillus subtilis]
MPQFTGIADVAIYVGDEFNPLDGITASDAESGNVTANITVAGTVDTAERRYLHVNLHRH